MFRLGIREYCLKNLTLKVKILIEVINMAKTQNSKLKLLHVLDILKKHSDEDNILTSGDIISQLEKRGLTAERRSIIRDIKVLVEFGYDISLYEENNIGYYMRSREFEEEELNILIDSVIAFKSLSPKKTKDLVHKLSKLSSNNFGDRVMDKLYIDSKGKSDNEKIYYSINMLNEAIDRDKKVDFKYLTYDIKEGKKFRKGGEKYIVSPYALVWCEDNYYLIGVHEKYSNFSHYRIDRINQVNILDEKRKLADNIMDINDFNVTEYIDSTFNVFTGTKEIVKLRFTNDLLNPIIDKFGVDAYIQSEDGVHSILIADVIVSEGFTSWIIQFGGRIELLEPVETRELIKEKILELNRVYGV